MSSSGPTRSNGSPLPPGNGPANGLPGSGALAARRSRELDYVASDTSNAADGAPAAAPNILAIVWRQRWLVLICVLLALGGGIAYLMKATRVYAASSTVYPQQSGPKIMSDMMASGGQRSNGYIFTQCQVLTSTAILRSAVGKPGIASLTTLEGNPNPVGALKSMITAEPDKQGELIFVTCESTKPEDAAAIANAVVDSYIEYVGAQHKSSAVEVLRILQNQSTLLTNNLKTTNEAMLKLKRENPDLVSSVDRTASASASRMTEIQQALTAAQLRQIDLKTAQVQADAVKDDPYRLKRVLDQYQLGTESVAAVDPSLLAEYRQERNQVDELTARLGAQHDQVKAAQRQLARTEGEVADATRSAASSMLALLQQAVTSTDARVNELQSQVNAARGTSTDLNSKQFEYEQLGQTADRLEKQLDLLDSRMKDLNVAEDAGAMNVDVLEVAQPNSMPVRPMRGKTLAMALMAGLMAGVGLALLRDSLDHRLRSVDEIVATMDAPVLGAIPHMGGRRSGGRGNSPTERGRFVDAMPRSAVAEAFRTLRTAVYFGIPEHSAGKTVLVTSPAPGDGKSTTASNLAIAFAQAGRRVLMIDADCRRPTQARIHGVTGEVSGLAEVLSGRATLEKSIRQSEVERLWILPAGAIPENPAELLDSPEFRSLLTEVSDAFDQVIIDSPPIVPVTDARVIAAMADATILVLRAERSTRRLANQAREALNSVGARLIGVVVSDVPRGSQTYGYYGAGRYGYAPVSSVDVGGNGTAATGNGRSANYGEAKPSREHVAGELLIDPPSEKR